MRVKTPTLLKNEVLMLYNQFVRTITTPSMLGFYIVTMTGALFVSSIGSTLVSLGPIFSPLGVLLESMIDRATIFAAIGLITLTSVVGGYFGIGPAEVLESPDEYILMVSPVHPHQLFLGRYIRRITRKFFYLVLGFIVVIPLLSQEGFIASSIMLLIISIIFFLEINYFLGGICSIIKVKLQHRYTSSLRHLILIPIMAVTYLLSSPLLTMNPVIQLGIPANQVGIILMEVTGIHEAGLNVLSIFGMVFISFFISLLVLSNISGYDYYEQFSNNISKEESESRFSRSIRGQVDFSESRFNDPMIWIILKDFWSKMRTPLQFWKYIYVIVGTAFGLYLNLAQPIWLAPMVIPPQYTASIIPAFLLILILMTQMATLTSLLAFVDEKDNIYLLRSSPFRSKDIVLAKYIFSILEVAVTSIPIYLFLLYFFRVPGSLFLITLAAPMIIVFSATGILVGAYVPVFTNDPKNPPVPLAFSFPAINLMLGGIITWISSEFTNDITLVIVMPVFVAFTVLLFLSLSVHALQSYK
ncbi:MAG: hypothetical protein P1Q69_09755 [Candidatus Thorarchaeota archaeon]|nr:hypothetical protein [Candidatus Thorarchaeota archaeon]